MLRNCDVFTILLIWRIGAVGSFSPAPNCQRFFSHSLKSSSLVTLDTLDTLDTVDDFYRSSRVDKTIQKLREQIPLLLVRPLDKASASNLYAESVVLLGPNNEELASDLEELVALSTTLVTASSATRQASRLARSLTATTATVVTVDDSNKGGEEEATELVSSQIILDASQLDRLHIKWETTLLPSASTISGLSQVTLDEDGLISEHKLLNLKIDDQPVNAVGEALATLRRAFKSVQSSPFVSLATSFPLLTGIRDELLQQVAAVAAATTTSQVSSPMALPPLFAVSSLRTTNTTANSDNNDNPILIDDFDWPSPLPGSQSWKRYAKSQSIVSNFIKRSIPILSAGSPKDDLTALFSPDCALVAMDGTTIVCSGGDTVADFYRVLASVRRQGPMFGGNWNAVPVDADWKNRSVVVEYVADSPVRVQGKDRYRLSESGRIDAIEQLEIVVQGIKVEDPDWFRQFYQAVKAGRNTAGAEVVLDLIEQLGSGRKVRNTKVDGPPKLTEAAAASVYGILRALHQDLKCLTSPTAPSLPAAAYLAPTIELRGYLNEVLVRGEAPYKAAIGALLASLRGALQSERVVLETPPSPTIVFRPDGTIGVDLVLNMRLLPIVVAGPEFGGGGGLGLKLELKFVYRVNQDGKIIEHAIVETRVNGQLTPGDVVTRLWKGTPVGGSSTSSLWPVQSVWDALNWARGMASSNS
jgi:hypothetical protein